MTATESALRNTPGQTQVYIIHNNRPVLLLDLTHVKFGEISYDEEAVYIPLTLGGAELTLPSADPEKVADWFALHDPSACSECVEL